MGTYTGLITPNNKKIHIENRKDFETKLEKIFQQSGMMHIEQLLLYGKKILLLSPVQITEKGVMFQYNYFENDNWEIAGYSPNGGVYSNKVGYSYFRTAMEAAYTLETLYMSDKAWVETNGDIIPVEAYLGWFEHLFEKKYRLKNTNLMEAKEVLFKEDYGTDVLGRNLEDLFLSGYEVESILDAWAVERGTEEVINSLKDEREGKEDKSVDGNIRYNDCVLAIDRAINEFKNTSKLSEDRQIQYLLRVLRELAESEEFLRGKDEEVFLLRFCVKLTDNFAFAIKKISEVYKKDFWDLYQPFMGRKRQRAFAKETDGSLDEIIVPITTAELFRRTADDLLFLWEPNGKLEVSDSMRMWFKKLKTQYDRYIVGEERLENPVRYFIDILYELQNKYNILSFRSWLEESLDNIYDFHFHILWKILADLMNATDVTEENKATILKRYVEVVGNAKLRQETFGI